MIELTAPAEVIALKLEWEKRYGQKCTTPQAYKAKTSRGGKRYYVRGPGEYVEEVKATRERIHEDYKASEKKRRAKRVSSGERMTQKAKEREEDKRWEEKFKKHEDPNYYGVRV